MTHPVRRSHERWPRTDLGISQPNAVRRNAIPHFLLEIRFCKDTIGQRSAAMNVNAEDFDRAGDVLQVLTSKLATSKVHLALDQVEHLAGHADTATRCDTFEPSSDVDAIAEHV